MPRKRLTVLNAMKIIAEMSDEEHDLSGTDSFSTDDEVNNEQGIAPLEDDLDSDYKLEPASPSVDEVKNEQGIAPLEDDLDSDYKPEPASPSVDEVKNEQGIATLEDE
ncbi:hypothetical protein AAFF_G00332610 [Aldrovandia affinis]|uniref:Uncharacterized protein n=1 Tax=Aldrovandia affinis TaxID=143900 RepID=A0AAD7SLI4_9TELE|nr:hypothetical protein AAFF_G00332610 [Aldrovandia affinis]